MTVAHNAVDNVRTSSDTNGLIVMLTADRRIDRRILLEVDALEHAGWHVKIIAMPVDGDEADSDTRIIRLGVSAIENPKEFVVLSAYRKMRSFLSMNSPLMRRLKAFAWTHFIDQERFYKDLFLAEALRHRPHVIVAHDLPMLPVAVAAAQSNGAHVVYDSHELFAEQEFSETEKRKWRAIEQKYIGFASRVITVNESIAAELEGRYSLSDVKVILNAEQTASFERRPERLRHALSLPAAAKIGLFQGGLSEGRNLHQLVDAIKHVEAPNLHLVFLGDGQLKEKLRKRALRLGLQGRVHFLDAVPQSELLEYTASADFGFVPYLANCLNTYYCTPNKLFEFIAAGIPIIASDLPELRRFVSGNDLGLILDFNDPKAVGNAVSNLIADDGLLSRLRANLISAQASISWKIEGEKLTSIFAPFRTVSRIN